MKLPYADEAIIDPDKLRLYLLNVKHKRGKSKAKLLYSFGYTLENWQQLAIDLRQQHLTNNVTAVRDTMYGKRYEIHAPLMTRDGRSLTIRSIWQIDNDTVYPRFITLFPD